MKSMTPNAESAGMYPADARPSSLISKIASNLARARRLQPLGQSLMLLAARLLYGGFFIETGYGKLANLERTAGFFESLHLPAPLLTAAFVGGIELVGGVLLAVGLGARFAAAALVGVMITALLTAHADAAFMSLSAFTEQEPFPFLAASLLVLSFGAGHLSLDGFFSSRAERFRRKAEPKAAN